MNIVIYTTSYCPYCDETKNFFDKKNIAYETKNIDLDRDAYDELLQKLNGQFRGTPVIDINGDIIEGFDKAKINKLINHLTI